MKKLIVVLTVLAMLLQAGALVSVSATDTPSYHSSLITHWDFEGETPYADKAAGGASSDTLTANGSDIVIDKGVAYIPDTAGTYLWAEGDNADLTDVVDKTIVTKVALVNDPKGRTGVAGVFGKKWTWQLAGHGVEGTVDDAVVSYGFGTATGKSTTMNEFRLLVVTFDKINDSYVEINYYISNKEVPESAADFTLLLTDEGNYVSGLTDSYDFFLGRRRNHLDAERNLLTYFDDVKIYSSILTLDEVAADAPSATTYELVIAAGISVPEVNTNYEKLQGIGMYAIGDSYFAGHGGVGVANTWHGLLSSKYNMNTTTDAVSGSTVASWTGYNTDKVPMVLRYESSLPASGVDIVLIEGGRNDRGVISIGTNDSTDSTTFKGALNVMINTIKSKHPNALVILVTPWGATDKIDPSTVDYADAMLELARHRGDVKCIYAADPEVSGININDAEFRADYCIGPADYSHLNIFGMKVAFPYFEEAVARLYYEHIGETFVDQTPNEYYKEISLSGDQTTEATTAAPEPDATTTAAETTAEEKKGCGSVLALPVFAASAAISAYCVVRRKKK
ncbi:MAG: SGNH/GDSL hydrolase family protein [Clostridia bacterium]|nr:SGNH/GDSL hydrolase family protein [Clostridia bacterium]